MSQTNRMRWFHLGISKTYRISDTPLTHPKCGESKQLETVISQRVGHWEQWSFESIRVHIISAAISQPIIDIKKLSFDADIFKDITTGGLSGPWCLILLWVKASQAELNFCRMLPLIQIILRVLRAQNKQLTKFLRRSNLSEWPTWRATCPSNIQMQVRDLELPSLVLFKAADIIWNYN